MANTKGRTYAEDLVGALDRSALGLQRDVAQSSYNTNWKNIQNQYENLQAQLKQKQQQANERYANGLVDVAGNSYDRMRSAINNMSNRNVINSGMQDLARQSDIKQKGQEVDALLDEANEVAKQTAEGLSQGGTSANAKANELAGNLAKTLGEITSSDIAKQNQYNSTLASLAEAMETREDNNARVDQEIKDMLSSARRSASGGNKDIDDKMEELYKRQGMMEIIASDDLTSEQKTAYLAGLYEVRPETAMSAVDAYNNNKDVKKKYDEQVTKAQKKANSENNKIINKGKPSNQVDGKFSSIGDNKLQYSGINANPSKPILAKDVMTTNAQHELDELLKNGMDYRDIYNILYK